jgi:DNA repair photolyase
MELVGIARLASQSELLEAKREVQYFELPARSILNRTRPNLPFQWTINPYRGCEYGCKYCYARYTHEFMEMAPEDFEDKI